MTFPRFLHRWYAWLAGYFWMPCPLCKRPFGGHEAARALLAGNHLGIYAGDHAGKIACPQCVEKVAEINREFPMPEPESEQEFKGVVILPGARFLRPVRSYGAWVTMRFRQRTEIDRVLSWAPMILITVSLFGTWAAQSAATTGAWRSLQLVAQVLGFWNAWRLRVWTLMFGWVALFAVTLMFVLMDMGRFKW